MIISFVWQHIPIMKNKIQRLTHRFFHSLDIIAKLSKAKKPISVSRLATDTELSDSYIENLMQGLKEWEIVTSMRGKKGGYVLRKPLDKIFVSEVIDAVEYEDEAEELKISDIATIAFMNLHERLLHIPLSEILNTRSSSAEQIAKLSKIA